MDVRATQQQSKDQARAAFLKDRSASAVGRLKFAQEQFMEDGSHRANPFEQCTVGLFSSPLRSLKTIVLLPVVVVRLALVLTVLATAALLLSIAAMLACLPKPRADEPHVPTKLPLRSWVFLYPMKYLVRAYLFAMGFHWISWTGRPAPRSEAPVVCPNHVSWAETFYLTGWLLCSGMSIVKNVNQPFVGSVLKLLQWVLVDKDDPKSRFRSAEALLTHVKSPDAPAFLIFPEGMCTNGTHLVHFNDGAFRPGVPVQCVGCTYPWEKWCSGYDPSNPCGTKKVPLHIARALFEWHNPMHVKWCDPYIPSEEEKKDSRLYARQVRAYMSTEVGLPLTEHTIDDVNLMHFAREGLKLDRAEWTLVGAGKMREALHFNHEDAKSILRRFENIDLARTGTANIEQFLSALSLPRTALTEKLFNLYDLNGDGVVNFREYLCAQAVLRGINDGERREDERALSGSPLHRESLDFAWHIFTWNIQGKAEVQYDDIRNVFERYAMPTADPSQIQRLFDNARGDKPAMDREAFDAFMLSTPEFMQLVRLGEKERSRLASCQC